MEPDIYDLTAKVHDQLLLELKAYVEQLSNKPHVDTIESGGIVNVYYNYYYDSGKRHYPYMVHEPDPSLLPAKLQTPQAEQIHESLMHAGLVDELWQPINLSGSERSLLAKTICDRLGINDVWQLFGGLWDDKPQTLRFYYNRALDQRKSLQFQDTLKNVLG